MAETYRLQQRKGIWYYYRRVPAAYVALFGKQFVKISLSTPYLSTAKKLRSKKDVEYDSLFDQYAEQITAGIEAPLLSKEEALRLVQTYVGRRDEMRAKDFEQNPPSSKAVLKSLITEASERWSQLDDPEFLGGYGVDTRTLNDVTEGVGYAFDQDDFSYSQFYSLVVRGLRELERRQIARLKADYSTSSFDTLFAAIGGSVIDVQTKTMRFGDLCDTYVSEYADDAAHRGIAKKRIDKVRASVNLVKEALGQATLVSDIDYKACQGFRKLLSALPANKGKIYPHLSLRESVAQAEVDGRSVISHTTQKFHLQTLTSALKLGQKLGAVAHVASDGLQPMAVQLTASEKRRPFTSAELTSIFNAPLYTGCVDDEKNYAKPGTKVIRRARFWVPLICLFTGMRANEICQLKTSDLKSTDNGILFFDVNDDGSDKKLKTKTSRRRFPVHPELIRIGFVEYLTKIKAAGSDDVFPEVLPGKYGYKSQKVADWFTDGFLPKVIEKDGRVGLHSFRHNFRDALRDMEAPDSVLQQLGGWAASKGTSDNYGAGVKPGHLMKYVERVEYPGLDLSHLHLH